MTDNELATAEPTPMAAIDLAIADKSIEPSKLRELLDIQERWFANQARTAFNVALVDAQSEMPVVIFDRRNQHTNSQYASFENVQQSCKKTWIAHGFSIIFSEDPPPRDDWIRVIAEVRHIDGHVEHYQRDAPMDTKGPKGGDTKTGLQGCQSTVSYLSRNLTCSIFGITVAGQDNDGGEPPVETVTENQAITIEEGCEALSADMPKMLRHYGISKIADLPASKFDDVMGVLKRKEQELEQKKNEGKHNV